MKNRGWMAAALGMAALIGCGGNVVVDGFPQGEGGAGGQGQGGPVLGCSHKPDPSTLKFCGGSGSSGPGGPVTCETTLCDDKGNTFDAVCHKDTCDCAINGVAQCSCALNGPGDFCGGTPTCCPWGK